jgi:nucleoside-diphosphate-sugar epimerase
MQSKYVSCPNACISALSLFGFIRPVLFSFICAPTGSLPSVWSALPAFKVVHDLSFSKNQFSFALYVGLPVTIIRPGTIVGHTTTGAANPTDYAPSIISAFARMQEYVGSDGRFDLNPVDMVARASILLSLQSSSKDLRVFHLVDAGKASNSQVGRVAAGVDGRELSFAEFKASVIARLDSGIATNGAETLKPFLPFLETNAFFTVQRPYHSAATVAALDQLGLGWQCDSIDCVKRIVSFLEHQQ